MVSPSADQEVTARGGNHGRSRFQSVVGAFFANPGIAVARFVAFFFTGAASMPAEAIHSCADTGNQALLLGGGRSARRQETETHQFGFARERYFWSLNEELLIGESASAAEQVTIAEVVTATPNVIEFIQMLPNISARMTCSLPPKWSFRRV